MSVIVTTHHPEEADRCHRIAVLDGGTLDLIDEFATEDFTRLNPAGDGRHVFVTMSEGFQLLDTGTWTDAYPVEAGQTWTSAFSGVTLPGLSISFV